MQYILPITPIDSTLQSEGEAADAKAVGDALAACVCYPNYASPQRLGDVGTFTASKNGFVQLKAASNATEVTIFHRVRINNFTIDEGHTAARNYTYYTSPLFPVMAGDTVEIQGGTAGVTYNTYLYGLRR